jgi:hypothetical protein
MPIVVYEPFLEATQDEKQYRVVKDRERWFNVVMGERLELDEASTDRLAARIPPPDDLARALTLHLGINQHVNRWWSPIRARRGFVETTMQRTESH